MLLILTVLKYVLIAVAVLLLFLFLLLLFLLFFPFRDKLKGSKEKEAERTEGDFHLRFPGVHFSGESKEGKLRYRGKILFFTLLEGGEE